MKLKLDLVIHKRARDEEKKKEEGSEVGQSQTKHENMYKYYKKNHKLRERC